MRHHVHSRGWQSPVDLDSPGKLTGSCLSARPLQPGGIHSHVSKCRLWAGGAHSGNSQSTFQRRLDRLKIAKPCYERGVAYINATATTLIHRLTRLIPLKPEVRSIVVSTSAFESEGHWFEPTLESVGVLASLVFVSPFLPIWAKKNGP